MVKIRKQIFEKKKNRRHVQNSRQTHLGANTSTFIQLKYLPRRSRRRHGQRERHVIALRGVLHDDGGGWGESATGRLVVTNEGGRGGGVLSVGDGATRVEFRIENVETLRRDVGHVVQVFLRAIDAEEALSCCCCSTGKNIASLMRRKSNKTGFTTHNRQSTNCETSVESTRA